MSRFITITDPHGRKVAINVAHIIAVAARIKTDWEADDVTGTWLHTSVGTDQRSWGEWTAKEDFDTVMAMIGGDA